jgi:wobble nucleotide-excising tRNase
LSFRKYNIVFGQNGQGKSALSQGLRDIAARNDGAESVRFFDRDYVSKAMLLEDGKGAIKGVVAEFGNTNVQIAGNVNDLKKEIETLTSSIENANAELDGCVRSVENNIDAARERHKGTLTIRNKQGYRGGNRDKRGEVEKWISDYGKARAEHPDTDFSSFRGDNSNEERKRALEALAFDAITAPSEDQIEQFAEALAYIPGKEEIPAATVVDWLERGVELHEWNAPKCKFCGGDLNLESVRERVEHYRNDARTKNEACLKTLKEKVELALKPEKDICGKASRIWKLVNCSQEQKDAALHNAFAEMHLLEDGVASKLENMRGSSTLNISDIESAFSDLFVAENAALEAVNHEIDKVNSEIDDAQIIARGAIGFDLEQDKNVNLLLKRIDMLNATIEKNASEKTSKLQSIRKLKEQQQDIAPYADYLNDILSSLNMPFDLHCSNGVYKLQLRDSSQTLSVSDISEGEKNLFALTYFYYDLFMDAKQLHLRDEISTVIVDDPTSSMDAPNRFFVLSLMKALLSDRSDFQIFIFTHVWDDFCELSLNRESRDDTALLEVRKSNNVSCIFSCNSNVFPYRKLFKEVYVFSRLPEDSPDIDDFALHMPNTIRRVLEEYVSYHAAKPSVSSGKENVVGMALFNDQDKWDKASSKDKGMVSRLISISNVYSHRFNATASSREIHDVARFMMRCIEEHNKTHFIAMTS